MMRYFLRLSLVILALAFSISVPAQNLPPLAPDGSVVSGALENGISFYIVTNAAQSGMADFALVRKGCADTLDARLELSSLPHFNKTVPHKFLNRKGIPCREEGFISYAEGSTIFRFDNVPVYDQAASDTTLLMLFDLIAAKPCQHAIVIAGNVAPPTIIEKMKVFSLMVPSRTPVYTKPEYSFAQGSAASYSFTPAEKSTLTVDIRTPRTPDAQMNTIQPFMSELFSLELAEIVKDRLKSAFTQRRVGVKSFDVEYVGSAASMGDEHFIIKVSADEDQMVQATMAVASVLAETSARGVPDGEYVYARNTVYRKMRSPLTNDDLVKMCISNYFTGSDLALPSTKVNFFAGKNLDADTEHNLFNNYVDALLHDTGNMSVHWTGEDGEFDDWTRSTVFASTWKTVSLLDVSTIRWSVVAKDTTNLWSDRGKTKLKVTSPEAVTGGEIWTFANDIKVIYRKDQSVKGQFGYALMVKGGYSSARSLQPGEGAFFSDVLGLSDVSGLTGTDFSRLMKINGIEMNLDVNAADTRVSGTAASNELGLVLRSLLSLTNSRSLRKSSFDAYRNFQESMIVPDKVDSLLYPDNPYPHVKSLSGLSDHTMESAKECFDNQFIKINDGVIVLVGDLPYDATQKLLSNYLGCFRISKNTSGRPASSYKVTEGLFTLIEEGADKSVSFGLAVPQKFTPDNRIAFRVSAQILQRRLAAAMARIGYSVTLTDRFGLFPQESMEIKFECRPCPADGLPIEVAGAREATDALLYARKALQDALTAPADPAELQAVKATVAASYAAALADKNQYINAVLMRYSFGKDMLTGYANKINAVSPQSVKNVFDALAGGRRVEYVIK